MGTTNNYDLKEDLAQLRHPVEYEKFVLWTATPSFERVPATQKLLAKKLKVTEDTLSDWKKRSGFWVGVKDKRQEWGRDKTPNILHSLYQKAVASIF